MWLTKLRRMMEELPQEFMEPEYMEMPPPPEVRPVGQLTEEEQRLLGVIRQIEHRMNLEAGAHEALYAGLGHSDENCLNFNISRYLHEEEYGSVFIILTLSIRERLALPESDFTFNGNDIYAFENQVIEQMRHGSKTRKRLQKTEQLRDEDIPYFDPLASVDPKKIS